MTDPVLLLAFGFGSGLFRKAPGTLGTLAALPICWLSGQWGGIVYSVLTVVVAVAGVWLCGHAAKRLGEHDFGGIVWDEIAGLLVAMWGLPFTWSTILAGFALFRLFDIMKPWPIRWVDRHVEGGFGIMLDDILAGLLTAAILHAAVYNDWL